MNRRELLAALVPLALGATAARATEPAPTPTSRYFVRRDNGNVLAGWVEIKKGEAHKGEDVMELRSEPLQGMPFMWCAAEDVKT